MVVVPGMAHVADFVGVVVAIDVDIAVVVVVATDLAMVAVVQNAWGCGSPSRGRRSGQRRDQRAPPDHRAFALQHDRVRSAHGPCCNWMKGAIPIRVKFNWLKCGRT